MGVCQFCKQEILTEEEPWKVCTCDGARKMQYRMEQLLRANEAIEFVFGDMIDGHTGYGDVPVSAKVREMLNGIVPHLLDGEVKSVTVAVPNICTATIKLTGEKVKISRRQSKKVEENI